jgi:multiple antibiotic resistance protein
VAGLGRELLHHRGRVRPERRAGHLLSAAALLDGGVWGELAGIWTQAFVTFFVAIDPIGLVPLFIALARGRAAPDRRQVALRGVLVGAAVLFVFALFGEATLTRLGIHLPAFRIAGGITLLLMALEMVFERRAQRRSSTAETLHDERPNEDLAVFPLAIPLIAGPAAITAVILQVSGRADDPAGKLAVCAALLAVLVITLLLLLASSAVGRWLSPTLTMIMSRVLGLLLAALAVEYILVGLKAALLTAP